MFGSNLNLTNSKHLEFDNYALKYTTLSVISKVCYADHWWSVSLAQVVANLYVIIQINRSDYICV